MAASSTNAGCVGQKQEGSRTAQAPRQPKPKAEKPKSDECVRPRTHACSRSRRGPPRRDGFAPVTGSKARKAPAAAGGADKAPEAAVKPVNAFAVLNADDGGDDA